MKDGTSHTMVVAEKFVQPDDYGDNGWADDSGIFGATDEDNTRSTGLWTDPAFPLLGRSILSNPARDQNTPNNSDQNNWNTNCGNARSFGLFGSSHPAGINSVFGDGSVHIVKFGIDPDVFNALGRMDDGTNLEGASDDY